MSFLPRPLRFLLVGALNTGLSYALYAALVYAGLGIALASFVALLAGIVWGYATQGRWVFGHRSAAAFVRFVGVWALIYAVYVATVLAAGRFGVGAYGGGLIATPLVAALSYALQSRFVFRPAAGIEGAAR